jgi:hypothetical protein
VLTPDGAADESLSFKESPERVSFEVSRLAVYDMVLVSLE